MALRAAPRPQHIHRLMSMRGEHRVQQMLQNKFVAISDSKSPDVNSAPPPRAQNAYKCNFGIEGKHLSILSATHPSLKQKMLRFVDMGSRRKTISTMARSLSASSSAHIESLLVENMMVLLIRCDFDSIRDAYREALQSPQPDALCALFNLYHGLESMVRSSTCGVRSK